MKNTNINKMTLCGLILSLFTLAAVTSTTHAAGVTLPPSLNPGDEYRLIYITNGARSGASALLSDYDAFVTADAAAISILAALGTTWQIIGSAGGVWARDHTNTNPASGSGVPIFNLAGLNVANNNADLWDGTINNFNTDATGGAVSGRLLSGTDSLGQGFSGPLGVNGMDYASNANGTDFSWIAQAAPGVSQNDVYRMYGISGVLTAVPEPGSAALLGLGTLLLAARRRRSAQA